MNTLIPLINATVSYDLPNGRVGMFGPGTSAVIFIVALAVWYLKRG